MRKIKFRGQTENGVWVSGYLVRKPYTNFSIVDKDGIEHENINVNTIAQFIGTDKTGLEIYEGDSVIYECDGIKYKSTITLQPRTWAKSVDLDTVREKDEEFLSRLCVLTHEK